MILYIHGFASSGRGGKAGVFREHYREKGVTFFAPSLSYIPDLAVDTLDGFVEACGQEEIRVIGSSLGGFYAARLAKKYGLRAVLINPAMRMSETLSELEGFQHHYYDLSRFEWTPRHKAALSAMNDELGGDVSDLDVLLLLQKDDDVIDYRDTLARFPGLDASRIVLEEGGGHVFEGIEAYLERIDRFFGV